MGTSTQVHIYLQQYETLRKKQFFDPDYLKIISYHSKQGAVIDDMTHYIAGIETLKPIAIRPQGIHFVKLSCKLDFSSLGVEPSTLSTINYYSSLPITANVVTEVEGTDYPSEEQILTLANAVNTAVTFHQAAIDGDMTARTINTHQLAITLAENELLRNRQNRKNTLTRIQSRENGVNFNAPSNWLESKTSPIALKAFLHGNVIGSTGLYPFLISKPSFDSNVASKNEKLFRSEFNTLVMGVAFEPLKKVIFDYVCPNLKNEPFQLFKSV